MNNDQFISMVEVMLLTYAESSRPIYRSALRDFARHLKHKQLSSAGASDAYGYFTHLHERKIKGEPLAPKTIKHKVDILSAIYDSALDFGGCTENPFERVGTIARRIKAVQKRETWAVPFEDVVAGIEKHQSTEAVRDRALLAVLFGGGIRVSEAISIRVEDIQAIEPNTYLMVNTSKTRKVRPITLPVWASRYVAKHIRTADLSGGWLFPSSFFKGKKHISRMWASEICHHAFGGRAHTARYTHVSYLLEQGVPVPDIARAVGHERIQTTMGYDKRRKDFKTCATRLAVFACKDKN